MKILSGPPIRSSGRNGHSKNGSASALAGERGQGPGGPPIPVDWERLAKATAHPLRISILELLGMDGGRTLSPSDLCQELQIPLSNTNYHVLELAKAGLIELVRMRPVRGATEHFYRIPSPVKPGASKQRARTTFVKREGSTVSRVGG
jgi:DNA-binding transcriptional ArsR family regulator